MVRLAAVLGDYYHSYDWAKQTLETALNEGKQDVQIDYFSILFLSVFVFDGGGEYWNL